MNDTRPNYPASRTDHGADFYHGVSVPDPYRWLEEAESPEVRTWVEQQNALTQRVLGAVPVREQLHRRLSTLLELGMVGTPWPVRGRYFYVKRSGTQNQPILYVREGLHGTDRVLLDPNALAEDGTTALDWWFPSRDGRLLAYGLSEGGSEQSVLRVRDVSTAADLPDQIERTRACSVAWLPDGTGFYYTRYPAAGTTPSGEENYHRRVFLHRLGDDPARDAPVFGAGRAPEDWPHVALSPHGRWLVVTVHQSWSRAEVFFKDLHDPDSPFVPLAEKVEALYTVTARDDALYILTNEQAPRYRLLRADPLRPARADWVELIPEGEDVLHGVAVVGETLVADFMHQAASRLRLYDKEGQASCEVELPTLGSVSGLGGEWDGTELLFGFQSFTVPASIYHLDLATRRVQLWQQVQTNSNFTSYEVQQVRYPSRDGTVISMFLARRKDVAPQGQVPTLLYGYGGFNVSMTPVFAASRFLFLEQGGLLAIPNLRGGGEYGEAWHQAGMLGRKQNVFDDFLAAAEWLIDQAWTSPRQLVIQGGSNGGLLVGAALTQRPDLFRAVVCQVPLLDMLRYHRFLIARLWIPEYGSAENPEQFPWLYAYSPYHKIRDGVPYPAVLLATAESDTRVDALHARKMAARLQAATSSDQPILLRLETRAGHGAGKPRSKVLEELTDVWSFVFGELGIVATPGTSLDMP